MWITGASDSASSSGETLHHLGGPGLILLGIADNSVIPLPGSVDVLTVWLSAHHRGPWLYYAGMATMGAVLGGYITYSLAQKSGKGALRKKIWEAPDRQGLQTIRTLGILGRRSSCHPASAVSHCAFLARCGSDAVFAKEISGCSGPGTRHSLHHPSGIGSALWNRDHAVFREVLQARAFHPDCSIGHGRDHCLIAIFALSGASAKA